MFPRIKRFAAACFIAALVAGCATTYDTKTPEIADPTPVTALYIYSFLDLREGSMGRNFLAAVKRRLGEEMEREGLKTRQLWFNESPLRAEFALEANKAGYAKTTTRVPVGEVVRATQKDEAAFGASHRLIAFPAYVINSNTGNSFNVRWDLVNVKTDQVVWTTTSRSHHTRFFLGDEQPEERASSFVQGLMEELRRGKVIGHKEPPR